MNVLDNPHFVIKIGKWLKLKYYGHPEKTPDILWHHQWEMASEEPPQKQGQIQDFFLGGGALVSCSTSTPINHIVFFFLQNTSCIKKPQVISGGGGVQPLHPPPRSAPEKLLTDDTSLTRSG